MIPFNLSRLELPPVTRKMRTITKLAMLFLLLFSLHISANSYSQKEKLSIKVDNQSIKEVLYLIENQTNFRFIYESGKVNLDKKVSVHEQHQTVEVILNHLFHKNGIKYKITNNNLILINPLENNVVSDSKATQQKKRSVTGHVVDEKGSPIIGATVSEKGQSNGTITDFDGNFKINLEGKETLVITYIGYKTQEIALNGRSDITIRLEEDLQKLDEVVIVGYGTQKKINLTGSVATVKAEDIQDIPASNLSNALSGRLSGVNITQSAGKPGGSSSISIRAEGTWNSTSPLYVIDGVVRDKFAFDGLDASEVENLSVLKDGASAAIYGSRAANGVILVTTKKGKIGKPVISYTGSIGISNPTKTPKVLNAYEQAVFSNNWYFDTGVLPTDNNIYTPDELEYFQKNQYDWLDEAWKTPVTTRHSINIDGGNEKVRYYIGGTYYYETGSFKNLDFKKYSIRSNVEVNITKDIIASLKINLDNRNDYKPFWKWDDDSDTMWNLYNGLLRRTLQVPYIDGKPNGTFMNWHPLEVINGSTGYNKKRYSNYEFNLGLQYNVPFVKGLSLKLQYNKYDRHSFIKQFNRPYPLYVFKTSGQHNHITTNEVKEIRTRDDGDYLYQKYSNDNNYQLNAMVTYNKTFGKQDVNALLVYEQAEGTNDWFGGQRNYFISSTIDQLFAGSSDPKNSTLNGSGSENARISYVGRFGYSYDNKYMLEASFRYDGSVNFAPKNRWGFFPSVSIGWRISEENFWKNNLGFIDYFKFRGSAGLLGNDAVGGWQWMQRYKLVGGAQFGNLSNGVQSDVIPNENITWEKSATYNGGFDSKFLNNKLSLNVDAFFRHTYDILGNRIESLPTTFGGNMPAENYAAVDAKGVEVELGYNDKIGKDFEYYINGNISYATNKLITKDQAQNLRPYKSEIGFNTDRQMGYIATDIIRTQADLDALPANYTIFGQKPELGMLNYRDLRGANSDAPDGKIDDNDQDWIIKHTKAPINYGFSLGGSWKGLSIDLFFQGVTGIKRFYDQRSEWPGMEASTYGFRKDYWTTDNVDAKYPRAGNNAATEASTFWIQNASYLRLKNLNIAYQLPKRITSKWNISQVKLFLMGSNLFLLQDHIKSYDPENTSITSYPLMRSYSFGINLSF